ncbi:MAG: AmmeMemoRadiSam system protein B [Patescibacteria group bacterium]|jgi:poly-gamma-glutamate synthesis protein (capsule biosynthesis protein)|nr:AmmeMemoRadiSam system protein B [Patescibacteria group bacterium]
MKINYKILYFFVIFLFFLSFIFWAYVIKEGNEEIESNINTSKFTSNSEDKVLGGIIPHHLLAREEINSFFNELKGEKYDTVVLIGPDHFLSAKQKITTSVSDKETNYGVLEINKKVVNNIIANTITKVEEGLFEKEHSIFNLTPFIKKTFPEAKFIPIIISPDTRPEEAEELAIALQDSLDSNNTLVLASVDFSHYQPALVADFHDERSNAIISNFDMERVYSMEVDSPPSIYALLSYLSLVESQNSKLISHTNSGIMMGELDNPTTSHNIFSFSKGVLNKDKFVNFLFFGDMMLDRDIETKIERNGFDYLLERLAGEERLFFKGMDFISANLEGVFANDGRYYPPEKEIDFSFNPSYLKDLAEYNFNFLNLANNHTEDQSRKGFDESIINLNNNNFLHAGCLGKWEKECGVKVIEIDGLIISMVSINYFSSQGGIQEILEETERIDSESDYVIVNIHWGLEYSEKSSLTQQELAHDLIDSGVDLIIGHHPHVVQELEIYNNKPIFYSLGNFIFDQYWSKETQVGLSVGVSIDNDVELFLFPFKSSLGAVELLKWEEKDKFLLDFSEKSVVNKDFINDINNGRLVLKVGSAY